MQNLGIELKATGRLAEAAEAFRNAGSPSDPDVREFFIHFA